MCFLLLFFMHFLILFFIIQGKGIFEKHMMRNKQIFANICANIVMIKRALMLLGWGLCVGASALQAQHHLFKPHTPLLDRFILQDAYRYSDIDQALARAYLSRSKEGRMVALLRWKALEKQENLQPSHRAVIAMERMMDEEVPPNEQIDRLDAWEKMLGKDYRYQDALSANYRALDLHDMAEQAEQLSNKLRKKMRSKYLRKSKAAKVQGNFPRSLVYADYALAADSASADAYYYLAHALKNLRGTWTRRFWACNAAIQHGKKNAKVFTMRGELYMKKKDTLAAKTDFLQAVKLDSKYEDAYCSLGDIALAKKRFSRAISYYEVAIRESADNIRALLGKAEANRRVGEKAIVLQEKYVAHKIALDYFERALIAFGAENRALTSMLSEQNSPGSNTGMIYNGVNRIPVNHLYIDQKSMDARHQRERIMTRSVSAQRALVKELRVALDQATVKQKSIE